MENTYKSKQSLKTLPVVFLLGLYHFSELLKAVLGDILFNGRCDVFFLSPTGFDIDVASTDFNDIPTALP